MKALVKFILFVSVFAGLFGCAGKKPVMEPAAAEGTAQEAPRDSLRAKFVLAILQQDTVTQEVKTQEFDAVLFSVPGKRYRMELTGPLGIGVASLLWQEEGWQITFPTEKLYMKGVGYMVGLLNTDALPMVHIHQVADIFDGRLLPEGYEEVAMPEDSTKEVGTVYAREKMGRFFTFKKEGDHVSWLSRKGRGGKTETLHFYDFKTFEGVEVPSNIIFELDGAKFLEIKIKKIARKKSFSSGTWRLNIPKSFKRVGE